MSTFLKNRFLILVFLTLLLFIIQSINALTNYHLNKFGLLPRSFSHTFGILFSPFLHGSWQHLFANLPPFLILSAFLLKNSIKSYFSACLFIIIFEGILLWFFGRTAFHVGASGLIFGLWALLLSQAFFTRNFLDILLSLFVFFYFGAMAVGLLPSDKNISTEGHIFGALAGFFYAFLTRKK